MSESFKKKASGILEVFVAIPWGLIVFLVLLVLMACTHLKGEDVRALLQASAVFGLAHGVHGGAKHIADARRELPVGPPREGGQQ
jgi:hypothetical protein